MDIDDYVARVQPRKKRSRLIPFIEQILALKAKGYTDLQIRDWLAENNITISREGVRKFIKALPANNMVETRQTETQIQTVHEIDDKTRTTINTEASQADKMREKLKQQKTDAEKTMFKHDKTGKT